jgi:hypothetical protein
MNGRFLLQKMQSAPPEEFAVTSNPFGKPEEFEATDFGDFGTSMSSIAGSSIAGSPQGIFNGSHEEASRFSRTDTSLGAGTGILMKGHTFKKYSERFSACKIRHVELSGDQTRLQVLFISPSYKMSCFLTPYLLEL